mmetsp:Transcript_10194/g.25273  ORF Transcript_10194/g.25273 Transcript_10194/m.25273 type:complete len:215 (+) Transcript_10194:1375-2019(+)
MTWPRRICSASVPASIRSSFVITPIVRSPCGSTLRESCIASDVARSAFAGETARMTALGLRMYCITIVRSCCSMSAGWSAMGTRVTPGRSTSERSTTCGEKMRSRIGSADTRFEPPFPSFRSVSASISWRISPKSVNFLSGRWRNSPHSASASATCTSCSSSGRLVTIPEPRGRKSRPTRLSSTEDLPQLWLPTTTIWGSSGALTSPPRTERAS